jgi:hypothetical protein
MIDEELDGPKVIAVPVHCSICNRHHLINPATGKIPGDETDD